MKALAYKVFVFLCVATVLLSLINSITSMYLTTAAEDGVYDVTYLEQIDATCVKSLYRGKVVMGCMEGRRIEVQP